MSSGSTGTTSKKFGRRLSSTPSYWEGSSVAEAETHCSDHDDKSHVSHSCDIHASDNHSFGGGKGWDNFGSTDSHSYISNNELDICDVDPFDTSSEELTEDLVSVSTNVEDAMSTATKGIEDRSVVSYDPSQMSIYPRSQGDTGSNQGPYSESARYEKVIRPNLDLKSTNLLSSGISKFKGKRRDSFLGRKSFMKEMDKDEIATGTRRSSLTAMLRLDTNSRTMARKSSLASSILSVEGSSRSISGQASTTEPSSAGYENDVDLKKDCKRKKISPIAYRFLILGLLLIILGAACIILIAVFLPETMAGTSVRNISSSLLRKPIDDTAEN